MAGRFIPSAWRGTPAVAPGRERSRRVPHRVPCQIWLTDPSGVKTRSVCAQTVNLSACGLAVQMTEELPPGSHVEAKVPQADGKLLTLRGTVVHSRRLLAAMYEIGIDTRPLTGSRAGAGNPGATNVR